MAERLRDRLRNFLADHLRGVQYAPVHRIPPRSALGREPAYRANWGTILGLTVFGGVASVVGALGLIAAAWVLLVLAGVL